jgi:nitroreductase
MINKEILDILRFRHACKKYDPAKKISEEDFNTILEAGRLAPTSFGLEPYRILVVESEELKKKIYPLAWGAQRTIMNASHFVIYLARKRVDLLPDSPYFTHIMKDIHHIPEDVIKARRESYRNYAEKDFGFIHFEDMSLEWARKQTYIVMSQMLVAAAALGIDSCPIEGFDYAAVSRLLAEEGVMDPTHFDVSVMASFGYRAEPPRHAKSRQPLSDLVMKV